MLEFVFLSGVRAGVTVPVTHQLIAGRDAECSLEVPDPRVSRAHAKIEWDGVRCHLTDTGSSNGTFVNEQPIQDVYLVHGDVVRMGSTRMRVQGRSRSASQPPTQAQRSVFQIQEARLPEMTHAVSMVGLDQEATRADAVDLQQRLTGMLKVSEMLASVRTIDELTEPVLDTLFELLPQTDRAFLMLGNRPDDLEPRAIRQRSKTNGQIPPRVSRSICRAALEKKSAFVYREGGDQNIDPSMSMIDLEIRSAIAVPLMVREEVVGLVVLDTRDPRRAYGQRDVELAAAACHQVAISVKNAQLLEEVEQQTATRNNLMRFLPQAMADQVLAGELDAGLGGRKYRGTVLFSDIVGFTRRAETMTPEDLVALLNRFFNAVVPCIEVDGGSVDKFMGDAILAVWGIPIAEADSAADSVAASLSMLANLAALNSEQADPLHMGIGINTGEVVAGNVGTANRLEYTVLGDAVNTAQRIGAAACREQILVSEATWNDIAARAYGMRMPPLLAKNKAEPVQCYSVRGLRVGDELQLFVPIGMADGKQGWIVRRLENEAFIVLHEPGALTDLQLRGVELGSTDLGAIVEVAELAAEAGDGALRRSLLRLADPLLGGLLASTPGSCGLDWGDMDRNATARER